MILTVAATDPTALNRVRDAVDAIRSARKATTGIALTQRFCSRWAEVFSP
jgi:hypothetical protein